MSEVVTVRYKCDRCKATRSLSFDKLDSSNQLFVQKNTSNGLFLVSDIHHCEDGILGINNLQIDQNFSVRSFEYLTLPSEKKAIAFEGIPSPAMKKEQFKRIRVTSISDKDQFRLTILDKSLDLFLIIGDVRINDEQPAFTLHSKNQAIILNYFENDTATPEYLQDWLLKFINILEVLPPTKIGLFVDTLRYINNLLKIPPANFHLRMLKTILASHQVIFNLVNSSLDYIRPLRDRSDLFGEEAVNLMINVMESLRITPRMTLQELTKQRHEEISYLIYICILLEQEGLIMIERPKEINF